MDETASTMLDYASRIKGTDPGALVAGPEEWGWNGYFYSGYDQQYGSQHGWSFLPDRNNHGGADYLPWLLSALKADNRHLLDIFTVHYYPQGGEFGNDTSTTMQLLRNQSTRSLWDPNYVDLGCATGPTPTITPARRSASPNTTGRGRTHQRRHHPS